MLPDQKPRTGPDELMRCRDTIQSIPGERDDHNEGTKSDSALAHEVGRALRNDDVVRAIEYDQIDVRVKNGIVHLSGHIVNSSSQSRIMNAIRTLPGILDIHNNLVLDEKLTLEVATSLAPLEHSYDCKFFTGASHGILSLNGIVSNEDVKMLAEKYAAGNPNVRGVVNNVRVLGSELVPQDQPFLQPVIGETIYFLDGISGIVKQVIINPHNRRVTAMAVQGIFNEQQNELPSLSDGKTRRSEQIVTVPMDLVRYLTKASGFLDINSTDRDQCRDFDTASFYKPNSDWVPPYPYCPNDVLFPVEYQTEYVQVTYAPQQFLFKETLEGTSFKEQFFANDSLGG